MITIILAIVGIIFILALAFVFVLMITAPRGKETDERGYEGIPETGRKK